MLGVESRAVLHRGQEFQVRFVLVVREMLRSLLFRLTDVEMCKSNRKL
jgi:hypothetical protein